MQGNTVPIERPGLRLRPNFKHAFSVLILFFFISFLLFGLFGLPFSLRATIYEAFKKGANIYINYKTAAFNTLESENFILKYSDGDRDISAFMLDTAEIYYRAVQETIGYWPEEKVLLIIYPDQEALNRSFGWAGDESAAGAYWGGSVIILSPYAWAGEGADMGSVEAAFLKQGPLSHELTHYVVDEKTGGNYSRWLSEGLAQYVEEKMTGFRLKEPSPEQQERPYTLDQLERDYDSLPDQTLAYWQSLQTVSCLIDEYGMGKMRHMLDLLGGGSKMEEALQTTYGISVSKLEKKIKT